MHLGVVETYRQCKDGIRIAYIAFQTRTGLTGIEEFLQYLIGNLNQFLIKKVS